MGFWDQSQQLSVFNFDSSRSETHRQVGCVAGALSTIALHFSNRDIDTSGILQIYALPSLLGGWTKLQIANGFKAYA